MDEFPKRHMYYDLVDGVVVPLTDDNVLTWAKNFEGNDKRRVALTKHGFCYISTVFLGLDHTGTKTEEP